MAVLAIVLIVAGVLVLWLVTEVMLDVGLLAWLFGLLAPHTSRSLRRVGWIAAPVGAALFVAGVALLHRT